MTPPTLPLVDPNQLVDAGKLTTLKQAAAGNSPQALREAARQFESLFVSMVLKSMQQANFKDPLFGSDQQDLYQDMYDDQIASVMSSGKGIGLADMLVQQLRREAPAGQSSSSAAQPASATAQGSTTTSGAAAGPAGGPSAATAANAGAPPGSSCPGPAERAEFARALWPDAQQAARKLGVSPVSLLAQAALETNWGRSMPQDASGASSNNLFGIKAGAAWGGAAVESGTEEYAGGAPMTLKAQFRAYGSPRQCFEDYVALLRGNPRYAAAFGTGNDVQAFGSALQQGGYATDPGYASKLAAVANTLTQALAMPAAGAIQSPPAAAAAGSLKFAAIPPTTARSGALQRR